MTMWTIFDQATGAVLWPGFATPDADTHPSECGWDWDAATQGAVIVDRPPIAAEETFDPVTGTWSPNLAILKAAATGRVNEAAEATRARFLTPGAGQAMTYLRKEAEARAWTAGADPAEFPFLAAEASQSDMTIAAVVAMVVAQADAWASIGSAIEGLRRGAIVAIEAATSSGQIGAAEAVAWPAP